MRTLRLNASGRRGNIRSCDVKAVAGILSPVTEPATLLYVEVIGPDADVESVLAAMNSEASVSVCWSMAGHGLQMPAKHRAVNTRIKIDGWRGKVQHACAVSMAADLALVADEHALWLKLKDAVTTPVLDAWAEDLLPQAIEAGAVVKCESFGLPDGVAAWGLHPDATRKMDELTSAFVDANVWDLIVN